MSSIESSRLLMIDRDCPLATNIRHAFGQMGFFVSFTNSALNAVKRLAVEPISAILIGEVSNEIDALKLVKNLRQHPQGRRLPIVLMVTKPDESQLLAALEAGADDVISEPVERLREMVSRVRAIGRRRLPEASDRPLLCGPLMLDPLSNEVRLDGRLLPLRNQEFRLLRILMAYPGKVFERDDLLDRAWSAHTAIEARTVDVHIRRLRDLLGEARELIGTRRGSGYFLRA